MKKMKIEGRRKIGKIRREKKIEKGETKRVRE